MATTKTKKAAIKFPRVYVGTSVPALGLKQFTFYSDGYPAMIKDLIKQYPKLGKLIVYKDRLHDARVDLKDSSSALSVLLKGFLEDVKSGQS